MGSGFLLIILVFFALMYFMSIRPQQQRAKRRLEMIRALQVGDEIITEGGIYGEVKSLDEDRIRLEVDADVEIVVARQAVAAKVPPEAEEGEAEHVDDEVPAAAEEPVADDRAAR